MSWFLFGAVIGSVVLVVERSLEGRGSSQALARASVYAAVSGVMYALAPAILGAIDPGVGAHIDSVMAQLPVALVVGVVLLADHRKRRRDVPCRVEER